MRWVALIAWLAVCFGVAAVGGRFTTPEIATWYGTLQRPAIAPPNWLFGPVWTLLYALMAVAAWRIALSEASTGRTIALGMFIVQLALNLAWSWIFFRLHAIGAALAEIVVLWAAIGVTTILFSRITATAGWLMAPYWAWVSFAVLLNTGFWRLNRGM